MKKKKAMKGLTLIELLVVLLVILTLALVAVPPLLNARLRAEIARVHQDLQVLESAVEFYRLEHKRYPESSDSDVLLNQKAGKGTYKGLLRLTHPVRYLESIPFDRFHDTRIFATIPKTYHFGSTSQNGGNHKDYVVKSWILVSVGPDNILDSKGIEGFPFGTRATEYNPTNGLRSEGDIMRYGGDWTMGHWFLNDRHIKPPDAE